MLTESKIVKTKPREKEYFLCDGQCLYLRVMTSGKKVWVFRPRGKGAKKQTLGYWPEMGLKEAREARDQAAQFLRTGIPVEITFGDLAREWFSVKILPSKSQNTIVSKNVLLQRHILPALDNYPLTSVTAPAILNLCRSIERKGHLATTHICLSTISAIFRYGIATGRVITNPARDISDALQSVKAKPRPYNTDIDELRRLYSAFCKRRGRSARLCRFIALCFVRRDEARLAAWEEINLDTREWVIPAERMKMKRPHVIPLSRQAVELLRETPESRRHGLIFTNKTTGDALSTVAALSLQSYVCAEIGVKRIVLHGWRHSASTILNEAGFNPDAIERQLAHAPAGIRGVYNKARYMPERREIMQWWADLLTGSEQDPAPQRGKL